MATTQPLEELAQQNRDAYSRFRVIAAAQFSVDMVRENQEAVRNPPSNPTLKSSDKFVDPIMAPIAPYLCYISAPSAFVYGLFALRYSREKQGHVIE